MKNLLFALLFFCACSKVDHWKTYTIKKDHHSSGDHFNPCFHPSISFDAIFTSSCEYDIGKNQSDINKLYGFSEGDHRKNSARFGWRWNNNKIEILGYTHVDSKFYFKYITSVGIDEKNSFRLFASGNQYIFYVNGISIAMDRGNYSGDLRYFLFPYFGGDQSAPHDVIIKIKD